MKRQTNSTSKKTGLHYWEIGLVLINILLAVNGIIFSVVMYFFLKWGVKSVTEVGQNRIVGTFNNDYASKNFFAFNVPIMFLGILSIFVSILGFFLRFRYKKTHKIDLIIYIGLVECLFVSNLILLTYTLAWWPNLENNYRGSLKETVKIISEQRNEYLETECNFMRELSEKFSCCGYDVEDSNNVGWKEHGKFCCEKIVDAPGCFQPSLDHIKAYHIWFFVTPSCFSLLCELVLAIFAFLIYRSHKASTIL
jgi:hypothetical protein